jgi:hypothetical protein
MWTTAGMSASGGLSAGCPNMTLQQTMIVTERQPPLPLSIRKVRSPIFSLGSAASGVVLPYGVSAIACPTRVGSSTRVTRGRTTLSASLARQNESRPRAEPAHDEFRPFGMARNP